jgi:hypothetical protein
MGYRYTSDPEQADARLLKRVSSIVALAFAVPSAFAQTIIRSCAARAPQAQAGSKRRH